MDERTRAVDLFMKWRDTAPGHVRQGIDAVLQSAPLGRADRADWQRRKEALQPLTLSPRVGAINFPIVVPSLGGGTLATVEVVTAGSPDHAFMVEVFGARVRPWLVETMAAWTGAKAEDISARLETLALSWREGRSAPTHGLDGRSADLATAVAVVSHLTQRPPDAAWLLSGALGEPGRLGAVDHVAQKRQIAAIEAPSLPPERVVLVDDWAAGSLEALALFETILGGGLKASLAAAIGVSATSLLEKARALFAARDESGAAAAAKQALELAPTLGQAAFARLVIGAQAIHEGRLDVAHELLTLPYGLEINARDGWSRYDLEGFRVRLAVGELDALNLTTAKALAAGVLSWLEAVPAELRVDDWHRLMAEAAGTLSDALAASGDLGGAIAARRRALEDGPHQEAARSLMKLAELLARHGEGDEARQALRRSRQALAEVAEGAGRLKTEHFLRIAEIRHGVRTVDSRDLARERGTPPDLRQWPEAAETVATLLASGREDAALEWFEVHVFGGEPVQHPSWLYFLVTSAARAVARGMTSPRWREGAAGIVSLLRAKGVDAGLLAACEAFVDGGLPEPLLARAIY